MLSSKCSNLVSSSIVIDKSEKLLKESKHALNGFEK